MFGIKTLTNDVLTDNRLANIGATLIIKCHHATIGHENGTPEKSQGLSRAIRIAQVVDVISC